MSLPRRLRSAPLVIAIAAASASCSSADGFSDLDQPQQPEDSWPEEAELSSDDEIVPDSSRLVGELDGENIWLARTAGDDVCLLVYPEDGSWVTGCTATPPLTVSGAGGVFVLVTDGQDPPEGATQISDNVYTRSG